LKNKTNEIFKCLDAIKEKIPSYKYNKKSAPAFMLMMWLSHLEIYMPTINKLNDRLFDMPDELVYSAMFKSIPKGKRFFRWDKGDKSENKLDKKDVIIKDMMDEYGFSEFEAKTVYKRYIDV